MERDGSVESGGKLPAIRESGSAECASQSVAPIHGWICKEQVMLSFLLFPLFFSASCFYTFVFVTHVGKLRFYAI